MEHPELIQLSASEWAEVYYALEYKLTSPAVEGDAEWKEQLTSIMDTIAEHVRV